MTDARVSQVVIEALEVPAPDLRVSQVVVEVIAANATFVPVSAFGPLLAGHQNRLVRA